VLLDCSKDTWFESFWGVSLLLIVCPKNFLPSPLVPPSLSLALRAALRTAGGDGAVAAAVGATLRQHDPEQRPALVASFHRILNRVLSFMHALWSNSKVVQFPCCVCFFLKISD